MRSLSAGYYININVCKLLVLKKMDFFFLEIILIYTMTGISFFSKHFCLVLESFFIQNPFPHTLLSF